MCPQKLNSYFSAGALGGLATTLAIFILAYCGITKGMGVDIPADFDLSVVYSDVVWGGIWGFAFLLPFLNARYLLKGAVLSALPSLVQLFIVFPFRDQLGFLGLELGTMTPLFVVLVNLIWGCVAGAYLCFINCKSCSKE